MINREKTIVQLKNKLYRAQVLFLSYYVYYKCMINIFS